jgi:FkbM family methyltransferase
MASPRHRASSQFEPVERAKDHGDAFEHLSTLPQRTLCITTKGAVPILQPGVIIVMRGMSSTQSSEETSCKVSVILPAHNAERTIREQLAALAIQSYQEPFEVVVVANRCNDRTVEIAESFRPRLPGLSVVRADERAGAAYARNVGISASVGEVILCCDADDIVGDTWVEHMSSALSSVDIVGGRLVPPDPYQKWMMRVSPIGRDDGLPGLAFGLRYAMGASIGFRREVAAAVGGFDESVQTGAEDVAFCLEAQRAGFRLGYQPKAVCHYRLRTSLRGVLRQEWRNGTGYAKLLRNRYPEYADGIGPTLLVGFWTKIIRGFVALRCRDDSRVLAAKITYDGGVLVQLFRSRAQREFTSETAEPAPSLRGELSIRVLGQIPFVRRIVRRTTWFRRLSDRKAWWRPIVDVSIPSDLSCVGGLALSAPLDVALRYRRHRSLLEPYTLAMTECLLRRGDHVLDVGANVGLYSVLATRCVGREGSVVAFEPNESVAVALTKNLHRHARSQIRVVRAAVGARRDKVEFLSSPNSLVSGRSASPYDGSSTRTAMVELTSIDELELHAVDLMKIDVEGWEPDVLDGATATFARNPDAVFIIELNPACLESAGYTTAVLLDHPLLRGMDLYLIDDKAETWADAIVSLGSPPADNIIVSHDDPRWYGNLVAVPKARSAEVRCHIAELALGTHPIAIVGPPAG